MSARTRFDASLVKAAVAAGWVYSGRGLGLLWIVAINRELGIAQYGYYALAVGLAPLIATVLENPFVVRSIRVSDEEFHAERFTRVLLGATCVGLGVAAVGSVYVLGYGLIVAGGELIFNAYKSVHLRAGSPDVVNRLDTIRQVTSIGCGVGALLLLPEPTVLVVSLAYAAPYLVVLVVAAATIPVHRPVFPGRPKEASLLSAEALVHAANVQGDLLLLGLLTDSTIAGYYSLASVTAWALVTPAQAYGQTFHESLRLADGALTAGPPWRRSVAVSGSSAALLAAVGAGLLWLSPVPDPVGTTMLVLAVFVFGRSMNTIFAIVMYAQHRDRARFGWALPALPLKLGGVAFSAFAGLGAVGAGIACAVAELVLLAAYSRLVYGRVGQRAAAGAVA